MRITAMATFFAEGATIKRGRLRWNASQHLNQAAKRYAQIGNRPTLISTKVLVAYPESPFTLPSQ